MRRSLCGCPGHSHCGLCDTRCPNAQWHSVAHLYCSGGSHFTTMWDAYALLQGVRRGARIAKLLKSKKGSELSTTHAASHPAAPLPSSHAFSGLVLKERLWLQRARRAVHGGAECAE